MTAGSIIKETRKRHKVSQRSLAKRSRTSQTYISRVERDEVSPSIESLARLMRSLGEQVVISTKPFAQSNQTKHDILTAIAMSDAECVSQAAALAYAVTSIATGEEAQ